MPYLGQGPADRRVGNGGIKLNRVLVSGVLPVGSEIQFLQPLQIVRRGAETQPVEMRPRIPVVVIVVQIGGRGDEQVYASRLQLCVLVKKRLLDDPAILSPSGAPAGTIPRGIIRHL